MLTALALAAAMANAPGHFNAKSEPDEVLPILWLDRHGNVLLNGETASPEVDQGVTETTTAYGTAFDFAGERSGLRFGNPKSLEINGNMTISAWVYPRSFAPNGNQSEIFFRGDDRDGLDPYFLTITADGTIHFVIEDEKNEQSEVVSPIRGNHWTHVTASLNIAAGEMKMYINGHEVATTKTKRRPLLKLEQKYVPGVGVGNVQNNKGPHNQRFDGMIQDLRFYDKALEPQEVGFDQERNSRNAAP